MATAPRVASSGSAADPSEASRSGRSGPHTSMLVSTESNRRNSTIVSGRPAPLGQRAPQPFEVLPRISQVMHASDPVSI